MLIEPVLESINAFGHSVAGSVSLVLTLNHLVASKIVLVASLLLSSLHSAASALAQAVVILLEDFGLFLAETFESAVSLCEVVFAFLDSVLDGVVGVFSGVRSAFSAVFLGVSRAVLGLCDGAVFLYDSTKDFFCLLGQSVLLLINLVPRTLYLLGTGSVSLVRRLTTGSKNFLLGCISSVRSAPLEVLIGLLAGAAILYLGTRLGKRVVRQYNITPASVARFALNCLTYFYVYVVGGILSVVRLALRCVLTTLAHVHVPRFHHAGDSDGDSDGDDGEGDVVGAYDSSDNEERERQEQKRRNYELLIQRKQQKQRARRRADDDEEDVEDLLLQQVEREREDKLCAICQDKEKCIMMLPCRHLCVCQDCQFLWQRHQQAQQRKCPMCRKVVRQTIKAYL